MEQFLKTIKKVPVDVPRSLATVIILFFVQAAVAEDDPGCASFIGWGAACGCPDRPADVSITWKARKKCGSCTSGCLNSTGSFDNDCVHVTIGLGKDAYQKNAGQLVIQSDFPTLALA